MCEDERIAVAYHEAGHAIFLHDFPEFGGVSIYWNETKRRWCGNIPLTSQPGDHLTDGHKKLLYRSSIAPRWARAAVAGMLAEAKLSAVLLHGATALFFVDDQLGADFMSFLADRTRDEQRHGNFRLDFVSGCDETVRTIPFDGVIFSNSDQNRFWENIGRSKEMPETVVIATMRFLDEPSHWASVGAIAAALLAKETIVDETHSMTLGREEYFAALQRS